MCSTSAVAEGLNRQEEFFEQEIRPLLIDRCQSCHDVSLQESDLRLDSRDGLLQGGLSGEAAIAGNPGESLLMHAVLGTRGIERMPPDEPLEDNEIALLRRWIKMGLPWTAEDQPAAIALGDQEAIGRAAESHWAFQPIADPEPPVVKASELVDDETAKRWSRNPIDAFIVRELALNELSPSQPAEREKLLRRLSFDLVGLPPTYEQVRAFVNDPRQDSIVIEDAVERLLASEHHGERWARYWLDLARYADTRDWQAQAEIRYPYAYTYRDYVIDSFNDDKPYNEFIQEQIAADYHHKRPDAPELSALGFLTVGPLFRNNRLEQAADKIDAVGRGLMGITISCARCHDHKYDPIPTEDYYSLYGVFASCDIPEEFPVIQTGSSDEALAAEFREAVGVKQNDLLRYKQNLRRDAILDLRKRVPTYLDAFVVMGIEKKKEIRGIKSQFKILEIAMTPLNQRLLNRLRSDQDVGDPVLGPWHATLSMSEKAFQAKRQELLNAWASDSDVNPLIATALKDAEPKSRIDVVKAYGRAIDRVMKKWIAKAPKGLGLNAEVAEDQNPLNPPEEAIRLAMMGSDGWFDFAIESVANASRLMGAGRKKLGDLEKAITEVESTHPGAPPRAMTLVDKKKPVTPFVLLRGEAARRGERVPRQFVSVLSKEPRKPFVDGSGRRELAEAITDPANTLTTRVLVNRVWAKYFGSGLVASLDDFGLRSEAPSHPELLDYLASQFMSNGWSLKWLHKSIVTSQTYAQSSDFRDEAMRVDPDNRLCWRQQRRRLDFEAMRDSILCAAGSLDPTVGGKSVRLSDEPYTTRRSVYAYVDRIELDPILRTFDFASPSASAASRPETTIPQQALFGMNHPFVAEQARLISRDAIDSIDQVANQSGHTSNELLIEQLYRRVFARLPSDDEMKIANRFLSTAERQLGPRIGQTWQYGFGPFGKLASDAFDEECFRPLTHWTGQVYQMSEIYPDPKWKFLRLTKTGGHPGHGGGHSVIRRWIAPADGVVNVNGTIKHSRDDGDGVIAAVRSGEVLETFAVCRDEVKTLVKQLTVKAGDPIDFLVSAGETPTADGYSWSIVVTGVKGSLDGQGWRSNTEFASPPPPALTPPAQLAQALLLTNEFLYLD